MVNNVSVSPVLLVWLVLAVNLAYGVDRYSPPLRPFCLTEFHHGWKACRRPSIPSLGCGAEDLLNVTSLPTTALAVLLNNRKIAGAEHIDMDHLYFSTNIALLPDISHVGRDFYTLLYEVKIAPWMADACLSSDKMHEVSSTRQSIRLAGTNYRVQAWLNGTPLLELAPHGGAPGMFVRRNFDVTGGGRFNILISPPDHPGIPIEGQGGE